MHRLISYFDFQAWLLEAYPGDTITYCRDRVGSQEEALLFDAIYRDACEGRVLLFQQRTEDGYCEYVAQKATHFANRELFPVYAKSERG